MIPIAALPFVTSDQYKLQVGLDTLVFVILALGLNVTLGWARMLDLGYVAFFGFGAYVTPGSRRTSSGFTGRRNGQCPPPSSLRPPSGSCSA